MKGAERSAAAREEDCERKEGKEREAEEKASSKMGWSGRGEAWRRESANWATERGAESGGSGVSGRRLWNVRVVGENPLRGWKEGMAARV